MGAVFKKEFKQNMTSFLGVLVIAWIVLLFSVNFILMTFVLQNPNIQYCYTLECIYGSNVFPLITFIPFFILSMRAFNIERTQKTDTLLYSLPISATSVVLGKYLSSAAIFGLSVIPMIFAPLIAGMFGTVNYAVAYGALLAYVLLGLVCLAISFFVASCTKNTALSIILNLVVMVALYFLPIISNTLPSSASSTLVLLVILSLIIAAIFYFSTNNIIVSAVTGGALAVISIAVYFIKSSLYEGLISKMIGAVAIFKSMSTFSSGVIDIGIYIYFASLIVLFVFFTTRTFEKRRWN